MCRRGTVSGWVWTVKLSWRMESRLERRLRLVITSCLIHALSLRTVAQPRLSSLLVMFYERNTYRKTSVNVTLVFVKRKLQWSDEIKLLVFVLKLTLWLKRWDKVIITPKKIFMLNCTSLSFILYTILRLHHSHRNHLFSILFVHSCVCQLTSKNLDDDGSSRWIKIKYDNIT